MTVRGAQGGVGSSGSADAGERRQGGGRRIHFEALVAIGDGGGAGFEAESMDVSPDGMRLRTAYLPEIGERLVCRFEAERGEVVVEGEVAWVNAEQRGGEFGLRFDAIDDATAAALKALCVPPELEPVAPSSEPPVARGTRMRLHIEGLAAPMKARVRDAQDGEIKVGSNLEFLKVGRPIELEDVDHGARREAFVDHVKVEIDPASSVPQLVVSLRFEGKKAAPVVAAPAPAPRTERTPGPAVIDAKADAKKGAAPEIDEPEIDDVADEASMDAGSGSTSDEPAPRPERKRAAPAAPAAEGDEVDGEKFLGTGAKAARAGMAAANKIVPALKVAGAKAKTAMAGLLATVQKKRAERAEHKKASAPKRTTAPAPNGALKAEGKRLVRDDGSDDDASPPEATAKPKINRKAAAIGGALGLVVVLGAFAATRGPSKPAEPVAAAAAAEASAAPSAMAATLPMPSDPGPGGAITAQVPLFGATPMSTTESVPTAPGAVAAATAPGMPTNPEPVAAAGDGEEPGGEDGDTGGAAKATGVKEWGHGSVKKPVVLKLKMDGAVEGLNGASGAMGFTISLPGRRALSSASELARKDKRIASINVVNSAHGADVSIQFKDGVPPYMAKAKGDVLEIDLGSESEHSKKVASKGHKKDGDKPSKKKKSKKK